MIPLDISKISDSFSMLGIGMGVVFLVLLLLWFSFVQLKNIIQYFDKRAENKKNKSNNTVQTTSNTVELTADVNAAISMALYLHFNEQHDHESEILTIQTMQRRYSPWSSKIYGLNILKR
jgi:glutaconyl-CoA/methylmalonyl-CoA decarboxylase subunit delta